MQGYDPADLDEVQAAVADGLSTLGFAVAQGYDSLTRAVFAAMSNRECLPILQQASGVLCFVAGSEDIPDSWVRSLQLSKSSDDAHTKQSSQSNQPQACWAVLSEHNLRLPRVPGSETVWWLGVTAQHDGCSRNA
jgi:hypothetical protein